MEKVNYKKEIFIKTLNALERDIRNYNRIDIDEDLKQSLVASNVKHFEMTYEAAWKFLKFYLEDKFDKKLDSPSQIFKECFYSGIIDEQTSVELLNIKTERNASTHEYCEETAQEICTRIRNHFSVFKNYQTYRSIFTRLSHNHWRIFNFVM